MANLDRLGDALLAIHAEEATHSRTRVRPRRIPIKGVLIVMVVLCASTLIIVLILALHKPPAPLPVTILNKLDFAPFLVEDSQSTITADASSFTYSADQRGLVFHIAGRDQGKLVVSEQASPQEFTTPQSNAYAQLLSSMNKVSEIPSSPAPIYITRPGGQARGQTAVANVMGVLLFVQSSRDLSDDQWQQVLDVFYQYQSPDPTGY